MVTDSRPPLTRGQWTVLGLWLLLAMTLTVIAVVSSQGTTGFEDLLVFVAIIFFVFAVAAIVVIWAIARYLVSDTVMRWTVLAAGPPTLFVFLIILLRLAG